MTTIHRPNRPARIDLTTAAKQALRGAINDGTDRVILDLGQPHVAVATELRQLGLVTVTRSNRWPTVQSWLLTEAGLGMRGYLQHQLRLGQLAEQMDIEGVTGEDVDDVAASIDAGEETGSVFGVSEDFQLAFALAASLSDQSAEDLRQDLNHYLSTR